MNDQNSLTKSQLEVLKCLLFRILIIEFSRFYLTIGLDEVFSLPLVNSSLWELILCSIAM